MSDWYSIDNAGEIASPTLLLYPDRIVENLQRMLELFGGPARLRPHVKTHKLPQIVSLKRQMGIHKFKASTIAEAEMTAAASGEDVLLAYQPVGPNQRRLVELIRRFPTTRFSTLVDNFDTLAELAATAKSASVDVDVYLDLNLGMDRTGVVPGAVALELYRLIVCAEHLRAAGLHAYDGHLHHADLAALSALKEQTFAPVWQLREQLLQEGLSVPNVIVAGTPTSRMFSDDENVEVGAGTTVLWDFGQAETCPDLDCFKHAAVLLSRVISRPTHNRLCLDLGHKAVASEMAPPRVRWFGLEDAIPVMHSEEHLVLETNRSHEYPVGSVLYGIPRHICPTVALHSEVWCVRDRQAVETWPVVARARRITI